MNIEVIHKPLISSHRKLIVDPCNHRRTSDHPIPIIRNRYPMAYAKYSRHVECITRPDNIILTDKGSIIEAKDLERIIVWFPIKRKHRDLPNLDWIKDGLEVMAERGLHKKYNIAFPAIGYYLESQQIDYWDVLGLIEDVFYDSGKTLDFHLAW